MFIKVKFFTGFRVNLQFAFSGEIIMQKTRADSYLEINMFPSIDKTREEMMEFVLGLPWLISVLEGFALNFRFTHLHSAKRVNSLYTRNYTFTEIKNKQV